VVIDYVLNIFPHCVPESLRYIPDATCSATSGFPVKQQLRDSLDPRPFMTRTTWEIFQGATLSLTRSGTLKDRLNDAYHNHLAGIAEVDLPRELREEFRSFSLRLTREPPLLRGEDSVRATIRKMSTGEAEDAAMAVVRMFSALPRNTVRSAPSATVVPLYSAAAPSPVEVELPEEPVPLVAEA
jgi:hypothetical protein